MTTILHLEIEHKDGEILSASVSNIKGPVFIIQLNEATTYELGFNHLKLVAYLQDIAKQPSQDFHSSNLYDDKKERENLL